MRGPVKSGIESKSCGMVSLMHDSPGRREDFQVVAKSNVYPLRCCATRLVENKCVAGRMLEVWPN